MVVAFQDTDTLWRANWIDLLTPIRDMSDLRSEAKGSHTPYLLIRKEIAQLIAEFLRTGWPR